MPRNRDAISDPTRSVTASAFAERLDRVGGLLGAIEVSPGGRCGVLAHNSLAHLEWTLAVPAHGRVVVSLNYRLAADELASLAADAGLEVLLTDEEHRAVAGSLVARTPTLREVIVDGPSYETRLAAATSVMRPPQATGLAAISYTGGTTGRAKGVMLSHESSRANTEHNRAVVGHEATQTWLHVCPMFHVAGTANVMAATEAGARQVILPRFDAAQVVATIERERVTHVVLVPTMIAMLTGHPDFDPARLGSLRHLQYAASPMPPDLQRRVLEALPHVEIEQFYGMTEAAPSVSRLSAEAHRRGFAGEEPWATRLRSVGQPLEGVEVEVRRQDGSQANSGEVGELTVRGQNLMSGYWERPEETAAVLRGGWYRTGDAGFTDDDGYLFLVDRLKDMIITGGENVYSVEVEHALTEHPGVIEAAVIGVPHTQWGEAVHAVVVVEDDDCSPEHLIAFCRERIAAFKTPRSIDLRREALPRSGAGKVLKTELRAAFWQPPE